MQVEEGDTLSLLFTPRKGRGPRFRAVLNEKNLLPLYQVWDQGQVAFTATLASKPAKLSEDKWRKCWALHEILAHASVEAICMGLEKGEYGELGITAHDMRRAGIEHCMSCVYGKMRAGHPRMDEGVQDDVRIGQHQHCDLVYFRYKDRRDIYFLAVDGATRYVYYERLESKQPAEILRAIKHLVEFHRMKMRERNEPEVLIYIHTDSDSSIIKLAADKSLRDLGVEHVHVAPNVHEKIAERNVQTIRDKLRTVLSWLCFILPVEFWPALFEDTIMMMNFTPNKATGGSTPQSLVDGKRIAVVHLQVPFGTVALFHNPDSGNSMEPRADVGFVIGHQPHSRALKVVVVHKDGSKTIRVVRDKLRLASVPLPEDIASVLRKLSESDPVPAFRDETILGLETDSRQTPPSLSEADAIVEGVAVPPTSTSSSTPSSATPESVLDLDSNSVPDEDIPTSGVMTKSQREKITFGRKGLYTSHAKDYWRSEGGSTTASPSSGPDGQHPEVDGADSKAVTSEGVVTNDCASTRSGPSSAEGVIEEVVESVSPVVKANSTTSESVAQPQVSNRQDELPRKGSKVSKRDKKRVNYIELHRRGKIIAKLALSSDAAERVLAILMQATHKELDHLLDYEVFVPVDISKMTLAEIRSAISTVMLVTDKFAPDGTHLKVKARFVIKGFRDKNVSDTTSPTVRSEIVMLVLNVAVSHNLDIDIFDVRAAFLEAELKRTNVLAHIDKDLADLLIERMPSLATGRLPDGSLIVRLKKALYGLKDAPRRWYETLKSFLLSIGFKVARHDQCLFMRRTPRGIHYVVTHVDDILSVGPRESMDMLRNALKKRFREVTENINPFEFHYLGMAVLRDRQKRRMFLNQPKYIDTVAAQLGLKADDTATLPFSMSKVSLSDRSLNEKQTKMFRSLNMLMYYVASRTRSDILYAVARLTTKNRNPTENDWSDMVRVAMYLNGTRDLVTVIHASNLQLHGAADASFAEERERKSRTGYVFWMGDRSNGPITAHSKVQTLVTRSTMEAELVALNEAGRDAVWMRRVLSEMGIKQTGPCIIDQDNNSCMIVANRGSFGKMSKSIDINWFWIHEQITRRHIAVERVASQHMVADGLTKFLKSTEHYKSWRARITGLTELKDSEKDSSQETSST